MIPGQMGLPGIPGPVFGGGRAGSRYRAPAPLPTSPVSSGQLSLPFPPGPFRGWARRAPSRYRAPAPLPTSPVSSGQLSPRAAAPAAQRASVRRAAAGGLMGRWNRLPRWGKIGVAGAGVGLGIMALNRSSGSMGLQPRSSGGSQGLYGY